MWVPETSTPPAHRADRPAMWDDFWRAREVAGFLPAKAGVTGMTAWTYCHPAPLTDEYDDLRGKFRDCLRTYRDAKGRNLTCSSA